MLTDDNRTYRIVNAGAHRKPAVTVGAPSVVHHLAFWQPDPSGFNRLARLNDQNAFLGAKFAHEPAETEEGYRNRRTAWHRQIDLFLARLIVVIHNEPNSTIIFPSSHQQLSYLLRNSCKIDIGSGKLLPLPSEADLIPLDINERSVRYEIFTIKAVIGGADVTVRAELRHEFWTLTFIYNVTSDNIDSEDSTISLLASAVQSVRERTQKRFSENALSSEAAATSNADMKSISEGSLHIFDGSFTNITNRIIETCFPIEERDANNHSLVGRKFADFRGLVLGFKMDRDEKNANSDYNFIDPPISAKDEHAIGVKHSTIHSKVRHRSFDEELSPRILDALWPTVKAAFKAPGGNGKETPEITASRFQGGRSIYLTSLGRMDLNTSSQHSVPVHYIAVVAAHNKWQLGRLLERIHTLGTTRLAAIWDLEFIQACSERLNTLNVSWQRGHSSDEIETFGVSLDNVERFVVGGLMPRIDRSSYYQGIFHQALRAVSVERITGFQPYTDFIQRRMGDSFDFVTRVGGRFRELRQEVEFLARRSQARNVAAQTVLIKNGVARANRLLNNTNKLLKTAEVFLVLGLVYYLSNVVYYVSKDVLSFEWKIGHITMALILLAVAYLIYSFWREKRADGR